MSAALGLCHGTYAMISLHLVLLFLLLPILSSFLLSMFVLALHMTYMRVFSSNLNPDNIREILKAAFVSFLSFELEDLFDYFLLITILHR